MCTFDWSNNGRYIAFAGEMDGPTWDLYVYNTQDRSISRLSSGIENIVNISWSPEGDYILHTSAWDVCMGGCERWWIARSDGSDVWELDVPGNTVYGWVTNEMFSTTNHTNGPGLLTLNNVDILANEATSVWPHQFYSYKFDSISGKAGINVETWGDLPGGFYLYDYLTGELDRIFEDSLWTEYWGNGEFAFIVSPSNQGTFAVRADGSYAKFSDDPKITYVSPDKRWIVC